MLATLRAVGNPSDRVTRFQLSASLKTPSLKRSFALIALTLMINAFWLLPNLYFIATAGSVPRESKQNRIFSQEYRLRNREHGYLKDVALLKGFYFNWTAYNFDKERVEYLMPTWRAHLAGKGVSAVGYVVFAFVVFGIALSFFRKNRLHLSFLPFFAVPFVFLMNHTFPFDRFFDYLAQLPLFEEGLRFVFTKFSILIVFSYAIFLSFFLFELFARIRKAAAVYLSAGVFIVLLVYFMSPLFQGHLISDKFKVKIPNDYFALWDFMKKQDDGIVLSLPLHTLSGWQYYNWGYQGAGFIWFGLKQPVLDRDFDRWSVPNEQAFRELQYGLYTRKPELFLTALKKYDVSYLLWDKENIAPTTKNRRQIVYEREIEELLTKLLAEKLIAKIAQFGDLIIYKHIYDIPRTAIKKITRSVSPPYRWNYVDFAYAKGGDYYVAPGRNYPFRNILELNDRIKKELLEIDPGTNSYFLHAKTDNFYNFTSVPSITASEEVLFADLYVQKLPYTDSVRLIFKFVLPKGLVQNSIYETSLQTGQTNRKLSVNGQEYLFDSQVLYDNVPVYVGQTFLYTKGKNFINGKEGSLQFDEEKQITKAGALFSKFPLAKIVYNPNRLYEFANNKRSVKLEKRKVVFSTENYQAGVSMTLETLPHDTGYIVMFRSRNKEGLPLRICLKNLYSNLCSLYDELSGSQDFIEDYFVIPPLEDGIGYSLSIDNISYGDYSSINELEEVAIIPFPYNFLSQIYSEGAAESAYQKEIFVLNQSYNLGWKAYANGKELKNHVLVNNWANGWILDPSTIQQYNNMTIRLVFLPQYLEFLGFGLLTIVFMALLWYTMGHETSARFS
ncbi:hypothetical protein HYT33_03720 [Candidatus Roizmanbacteria bacterium]|nr:hypothetical protein [Candidatus Roizmanbacteria bacterium]